MIISISTRKSKKREHISQMTDCFSKKLGLHSLEGGLRIMTTAAVKLDGLAGTTYLSEHNTAILVVDPKVSGMELCLALAHEFIHVKQFLDGRLQIIDGHHIWLGEDAEHYSYEEQPWEIEAYEEMFSLVEAFYEEIML
jgi:hypothetical protein